jgi:diphosphomevalonate decarboxylase
MKGEQKLGQVCRAVAHSNIALAKYWGKSDRTLNLPAVPSLSLTLGALSTTTSVQFDASLTRDEFRLNGLLVDASASERVVALLDRIRTKSGSNWFARVHSQNDFPTASGLASSASGFAALAVASAHAAALDCSPAELSDLARSASVSAARSIFGGFVRLAAGAKAAEPLQDLAPGAARLALLVAVTDPSPKSVGSTGGMLHTQATSPYYASWVDTAPRVYAELHDALVSGDFERLGEAMEHSTLLMHASMFAARPALIYFRPATLAVIECVRELRKAGKFAFFTIDAGAHVKVLTVREEAAEIAQALARVPGVRHVLESGIGRAARVLEPA